MRHVESHVIFVISPSYHPGAELAVLASVVANGRWRDPAPYLTDGAPTARTSQPACKLAGPRMHLIAGRPTHAPAKVVLCVHARPDASLWPGGPNQGLPARRAGSQPAPSVISTTVSPIDRRDGSGRCCHVQCRLPCARGNLHDYLEFRGKSLRVRLGTTASTPADVEHVTNIAGATQRCRRCAHTGAPR